MSPARTERRALPVKPWRPRNADEQRVSDRIIRFFRTLLTHTKGRWVGKPFNVLGWQEHQVLRPLFGRLRPGSVDDEHPNGVRQYRRAWIEVGKKSGKSEMAAGIGLYCLFADHEPEAEVYIGAVDRDQAALIFKAAARMVKRSPRLRRLCKVIESTRRIVVTSGPQAGSVLEALSADADSADGKSPSCLIFDEVHRYKGRDFYDTLMESMSAREQPIVVLLTTAGNDLETLGGKEHVYAQQVLEGLIDDPELLVCIWSAPEGADFRDWRSWQQACPSIGETVSWEWLEGRVIKAAEDPSSENSFRRFYLNQWRSDVSEWMPMLRWAACAGRLSQAELYEYARRVPSWGGLDLSQTRDLTALALVLGPSGVGDPLRILWRFWLPVENVDRAVKRDRVRYDQWIQEGWIRTTPGDTIDYDTIEREMRVDAGRLPVQAMAYDPAFALQVAQHMAAAGILMVAVRQGYDTMSSPTADVLEMVKNKRIEHGGNPVATWMVNNMRVEEDSLGRWRPTKKRSIGRIDGMTAAIMGVDLAQRALYGNDEGEQTGVLIYHDPVQISPHI